jgi:hypothetical protein
MKKTIRYFLIISLTILPQATHTTQPSTMLRGVLHTTEIIAGAALTLASPLFFVSSLAIKQWEIEAHNDWETFLLSSKKYNLSAEVTGYGKDAGIEKLNYSKNACYILCALCGIPGIALIIHGSKKIQALSDDNRCPL